MAMTREEALKRIHHEDDLINHRFTWLIFSQSFLIIALVYLRNLKEFYLPYYDCKEKNLPNLFYLQTDLLVYSVIFIGILISAFSFLSVQAAAEAKNIWRKEGQLFDFNSQDSNASNYCEEWKIAAAGWGPYLMGWVFAVMWFIFLFFEISSFFFNKMSIYSYWWMIGLLGIVILSIIGIRRGCSHYTKNYGRKGFEDNRTNPQPSGNSTFRITCHAIGVDLHYEAKPNMKDIAFGYELKTDANGTATTFVHLVQKP